MPASKDPTPDSATRQKQACEMRLGGAGYQQIADALGYASVSGAFAAVQKGFEAAFRDSTSDIRRLELDRLDSLLMSLWPKARRGDVAAVDRVLKVMERRARYLGLDSAGAATAPAEEEVDPVDALAARRAARRSSAASS